MGATAMVNVLLPEGVAFSLGGDANYEATADVLNLTTSAKFQSGVATSIARIDLRDDFNISFDVFLGASDAGADRWIRWFDRSHVPLWDTKPPSTFQEPNFMPMKRRGPHGGRIAATRDQLGNVLQIEAKFGVLFASVADGSPA